MNRVNLCDFLRLDSFDVEIPFIMTKTELCCFLKNHHITFNMPSENHVLFKSKLLALNIDFYISCQFVGEKMIAVTMAPDTYLEGKGLRCRYNKIQKAMEKELGRPWNQQVLWNILILGWASVHPYWMYNGIKIEHYIEDRFGPTDTINIKLI